MQLAVAPFYGEFFGFCIVKRAEETFYIYARNVLGKLFVPQTLGIGIFRVCRNICSHVDSNFSCG